jgi:hypothetical protein
MNTFGVLQIANMMTVRTFHVLQMAVFWVGDRPDDGGSKDL